jgi:THUMP domain-like
MPLMLRKAARVMIKTSPVLDIRATLEALRCVTQVHVVEWAGECKEVIYILEPQGAPAPLYVPITASAIDGGGRVLKKLTSCLFEENATEVSYGPPLRYLYEPSPAFLKSGAFQTLAAFYGMQKLHPHAHLYTTDDLVPEFPGRGYEVCDVIPAQVKNLDIDRAEISIRHFPQTAEALRKKLKLKEGGDYRIFATTLWDESRRLIVCSKLS